MRRPAAVSMAIAAALACAAAAAQDRPRFTPEQIKRGAEIYERNCSPCHGSRMQDPQGAFDLRKFPREERERFIVSVSRGKNQMPPWGGMLKSEDIEALWAYVVSAEDLYGH
jgi:mono/diheme cytochrome c family protein